MAVCTLDQWAAEGRLRTVVMDGVKKVSVTDVICASKGCSPDSARTMYARLVKAGRVPQIGHALIQHKGRGGAQSPIPVANACEVIQLLHALPGDSAFKRNASNVMVRYLGGDLTLTSEVAENRLAQERLAADTPDAPARIFGEAVEAGQLQLLDLQYAPTKRPIEEQSSLYIFHYDFCPTPVKIGRAKDVNKRRLSLEAGHAFRLVEFATYPGAGYLERCVHQQLQQHQSDSGGGTEWFNVSAEVAQQAIEDAIRVHGLM